MKNKAFSLEMCCFLLCMKCSAHLVDSVGNKIIPGETTTTENVGKCHLVFSSGFDDVSRCLTLNLVKSDVLNGTIVRRGSLNQWMFFTIFNVIFRESKVITSQFRSSHRKCFTKKAVLKNFAIFTGKDLCCSLFLVKL